MRSGECLEASNVVLGCQKDVKNTEPTNEMMSVTEQVEMSMENNGSNEENELPTESDSYVLDEEETLEEEFI
ncbi:hypothetical protein PVK06_018072 [Gossypium arboreum]|uniref:Uncharacterized protein n=1 Tax=Gossypium arboreum TaxID=29729 RepID=A0ABR0Q5D4_GOSAR|nr:hypothetical protein PVK06_018072 [Gossypium arboreum]